MVQRDLHNKMVQGILARLDSGELIPPVEGGVLLTRLQQVSSGYTVDDEGHEVQLVSDEDNPRMTALLEALKGVEGKFLVWCRFRYDVVRVHAFLNARGIRAGHYYGGTSQRDRVNNERSFREDPTFVAMVGQYVAGGQGLDFSTAGDIVWYSHTSDLLRRRQADERATRIGGRRVCVTDLVASGSNDCKLLEDLECKEKVADFLTGNGLRRYLQLIA